MTFDIGLNEVCVRMGVRYVITKFSGMDSLPNFLTHGAPLRARFARVGAPLIITAFALCNLVGRTYLMATLIIITAFAVRKLVGRVYLMVTLIIIIAFSLCNLVGRIYLTVTFNNNHCICSL